MTQPDDARGPIVKLIVIGGPRSGEQIELTGEASLGRAGSDIVIDDPELSRRHVLLRPDDDGLYVEDLKSLNGTHVDDQPLTGPVTVGSGVTIRVGQTILRVVHRRPGEGVARVAPARLDHTGLRSVPQATAIRRVQPQTEIPETIVAVEHLTLTRGGRRVLNDLSLSCRAGAVIGLLGPSGAGKSSLIRAIAGVQAGVEGAVKVFGGDPKDAAVRGDLGYVTQAPSVYADLTVIENLRYFAAIKQQEFEGLLEQVGLERQAGQFVRNLSGGQRARVSLAAALIGRPRLLLLDEPTVGLDPLLRRELWELFADLAAGGSALLVSSHVLDEARHCDDLLLLREGALLAQLTPAELVDRSGTMDMDEAFVRLLGEL